MGTAYSPGLRAVSVSAPHGRCGASRLWGMGTQSLKSVLSGVSAFAALCAVVLVAAAVLGRVGWSAVIFVAGIAVVSAVLSLASGTRAGADGRHQ